MYSLSLPMPSSIVYFEYTAVRQLEFHRITILTRFVIFVFVVLKRYSFMWFVVGWSFLFVVAFCSVS